MHRYEHSSRIGKLAPEVRTQCKECEKHLRQIMLGSRHCEGGVDVVGVVTPLRGGVQVVFHGDQVVEA